MRTRSGGGLSGADGHGVHGDVAAAGAQAERVEIGLGRVQRLAAIAENDDAGEGFAGGSGVLEDL